VEHGKPASAAEKNNYPTITLRSIGMAVKAVIILSGKSIRSIDENYFGSIDTEEKAYWLGFIAADGCINELRPAGRTGIGRYCGGHKTRPTC